MATAAQHSINWWHETRPVTLSDGTTPSRAIYACPANVQVCEATDAITAGELCDEINAVILRRLGV